IRERDEVRGAVRALHVPALKRVVLTGLGLALLLLRAQPQIGLGRLRDVPRFQPHQLGAVLDQHGAHVCSPPHFYFRMSLHRTSTTHCSPSSPARLRTRPARYARRASSSIRSRENTSDTNGTPSRLSVCTQASASVAAMPDGAPRERYSMQMLPV